MQVIPVLDLLDGHVVRAVRGERTAYRPIRSPLAPTSEPLPVARALLAASGARTLYIADLGAILQTGAHVDVLAALRAALPGIELWLDAGYVDHASMRALFERIDAAGPVPSTPSGAAPLVPVFGTESLRDPDALRSAARDGFAPILSLDRRAGSLLAATSLDPTSSWWPARVIAMTLDQVGSHAGPDLATLERLRADAPAGTTLIGAGGIRDRADLAAAQRSGADAWLVASALHDGRLNI
ncbi:HisA/HisF-related TIM barrel protein [Paraburkholderia flava]|uniref:HisA/HisF-related TIM barrel protein n=1 Tax=Paraburkholderia flava TaxID=2547393 RepID=UPI00105FE435|nr:HisA/HisF-related TIM barrel protein [Paraburkholderia flava]